MRPSIGRSILGGFIGTIVITALFYWIAPLFLGHPMDIAGMIATVLGVSWGVGMLIHWFDGIILFPFFFALVFYNGLPGSPLWKGFFWGVILWLVAEVVFLPLAGKGLFAARAGGFWAVVVAFAFHAVYGWIEGGITGHPIPSEEVRITELHHQPH
jgi:hypothetical protein